MKSVKSFSWIVFIILCIAIMLPSFAQYQLSPISPELTGLFGLSQAQYSSIFSAPMIPAVVLSLFAGIMVDRFGYKAVCLLAFVITFAGLVLRIFVYDYKGFLITMIMTGFTACILNASAPKVTSVLFKDKAPVFIGILLAASTLGMTAAMASGASFHSLKAAFAFPAVICALVIAAWFWVIKKAPSAKNVEEHIKISESLKNVLKCRDVWLVGLALFFNMGCLTTLSSFYPAALVSERGLSQSASGLLSSLMLAGNFAGSIILPIIIKKIRFKRILLIALSVMCGVLIMISWHFTSFFAIAVSFIFTGAVIGGGLTSAVGLPLKHPSIGVKYAGTSGGVVATMQLLGAVILPTYVFIPVSGGNYNTLFIIAGLCMLLYALLTGLVSNCCYENASSGL